MNDAQVLTAAQMRAAEQAIFDAGTSEFELMQLAASGAAEWIRRVAAGGSVTVLCGPGNNGGDGYVIASLLRDAGNQVTVIAPVKPKTDAAKQALATWGVNVLTSGRNIGGEVLVDCLFGSGLSRPLSGEHALLLRDLVSRHRLSVAVDVPSGIDSDSGQMLTERLPDFDLTLALGAWKFAHWCLPGREKMGTMRLVPIGIEEVTDAATSVAKPLIEKPSTNSHKYKRGLAAIVGGAMPGASQLAATAAMRAGAGYVRLAVTQQISASDPGLVTDTSPIAEFVSDRRISALLIGPGLGRGDDAAERLRAALASDIPTVLDADALTLLRPSDLREGSSYIATPHDGELEQLCKSFAVIAEGRRDRALAVARASKMVVLAKGPDSVIAAPDGRLALVPPAPSWLSIAGSGDVLAGIAVSRLATGLDPFAAACEAVWLHGEAARLSGPAFTPLELANCVSSALKSCL